MFLNSTHSFLSLDEYSVERLSVRQVFDAIASFDDKRVISIVSVLQVSHEFISECGFDFRVENTPIFSYTMELSVAHC